MLLIVGLGNPDKKYTNNRHNLGFMVVDALYSIIDSKAGETQNIASLQHWHKKHKAKISKLNNIIMLAKPQTFMNLSGKSVAEIMNFYKIPIKNILLVYDDIDSAFGKVVYRQKGSSGGHNGVRSISEQLGTEQVQRVKVGVGRPPVKMNPAAYVLQDFSKEESEQLDTIISQAIERIISWIATNSSNTSHTLISELNKS